MERSAAWPVISVQRSVRWTVSPCKKTLARTAAGTQSFSGLISPAALCAACAKRPVPTYAIQLTPDFEMCEYDRQSMVYEKEHLLINGVGKYPGLQFLPGLRLANGL